MSFSLNYPFKSPSLKFLYKSNAASGMIAQNIQPSLKITETKYSKYLLFLPHNKIKLAKQESCFLITTVIAAGHHFH